MPEYIVSVTRIPPAPAVSAISGNLAQKVDFKVESLPSLSTRYLKGARAMDFSVNQIAANCEFLSSLGGLTVTVDDFDLEVIVNEALRLAQTKREAAD